MFVLIPWPLLHLITFTKRPVFKKGGPGAEILFVWWCVFFPSCFYIICLPLFQASVDGLRRHQSLSPRPDRPKSEIGVRWADGDSLEYDVPDSPIKVRARDLRDRPRPKSDFGKYDFLVWTIDTDNIFSLLFLTSLNQTATLSINICLKFF